jgi:hypothetical protein
VEVPDVADVAMAKPPRAQEVAAGRRAACHRKVGEEALDGVAVLRDDLARRSIPAPATASPPSQ